MSPPKTAALPPWAGFLRTCWAWPAAAGAAMLRKAMIWATVESVAWLPRAISCSYIRPSRAALVGKSVFFQAAPGRAVLMAVKRSIREL